MAAIAEIKKIALAKGDTFLLARLDRFDRALVTQEEWKATAEKAEAAGRPSMAAFVARKFAPPPGAAQKDAPPTAAELPGAAPLSEV